MKSLQFYLSAIFIIMLSYSSCVIHNDQVYPPADACFATQNSNYTYNVNEVVYFNNCSSNAQSYSWDFGDGSYSNEKHPNHTYTTTGTYQVILTAHGYGGNQDEAKVITVNGTTDLDILIMYLGTDDPVSNCTVTLYGSEDDWQNFNNPLVEGTTDVNGSIVFTQLDPVVYYIDAYKEANDGYYYSNELQGYATDPLVENEVNEYNVYVELLESTGKSRNKKKNFVVRKIEKRKQTVNKLGIKN